MMSKSMYKGILVGAAFLFAISGTAFAQDHCSDATLNGAYGFRMSGQVFLPTGTIQREEIGAMRFDGAGHMSLELFALNNGNIDSDFEQVPGTYTINSNCAGVAQLDFADGKIVKLKVVLSKGGTIVHALAFQLIQPGAPAPIPVAVHGDGEKLKPNGNAQ
jgi:hypothetical protein